MATGSRSALAPQQRFVARRIVASTQRLVNHVMARQWLRIPALMAERRALLEQVRTLETSAEASSCANALRAAVVESDRLLAALVSGETTRRRS